MSEEGGMGVRGGGGGSFPKIAIIQSFLKLVILHGTKTQICKNIIKIYLSASYEYFVLVHLFGTVGGVAGIRIT